MCTERILYIVRSVYTDMELLPQLAGCIEEFSEERRASIDFLSSIASDSDTACLSLPDLLSVLKTVDYACTATPEVLVGSIVQHGQDVPGFFSEYQWVKMEIQEVLECLGDPTRACAAAARRGRLDLLKYARTQNWAWDWSTCYYAAAGGSVELLAWATGNGCTFHKDNICNVAATKGQIPVLAWAREQGWRWDQCTCASAARAGQFETVKWLVNHDYPSSEVCTAAASRGNLETLQWAVTKHLPWSSSTCASAAQGCHLKTL